MAKLSPDHSLNWVFISKPVLTATVDYTTSWALQNISADNRFSESEIIMKTNLTLYTLTSVCILFMLFSAN